MYIATMKYTVKPEAMDDFTQAWKKEILELASRQPGFIRMKLLVHKDTAMAMGTWEEKRYAEAFMALGSFKELMAKVADMLTGTPIPTVWTLAAYREKWA